MLTTVLPQSIHQTLSGSSDSITLMSLGIGLLYPFLRSWRPKASHYARLAGAVRCIRKTGVVAEQYLQVFVRLNQSSAVHAGSLRPATRIRPENGSSIPSSIGWRRTCGCFWAGITYLTSACTTRAASEWGVLCALWRQLNTGSGKQPATPCSRPRSSGRSSGSTRTARASAPSQSTGGDLERRCFFWWLTGKKGEVKIEEPKP